MTNSAKFYRHAKPVLIWLDSNSKNARLWLYYARGIKKNRAWFAVMLFFGAGPIVIFIVSLLTLLIP